MQQPKRILICPLDWGLGHATRCIPVIRELIKQNAEVFIAADGRPLELLKLEFPSLTFIRFGGYNISYPSSGSMLLKMISSVPKILKGIQDEHNELGKVIDEYNINMVISDNRYGCWSKNTKNVFITHQLMIKAPFGEGILHRKVLSYLKIYDECWIPDNGGFATLSGDLSHKFPLPQNAFFIGPLSRFTKNKETTNDIYDVMAIVSGPEPQRSIFEKILTQQLIKSKLKALIVIGKPESITTPEIHGNVKIVSHLPAEAMQSAISSSSLIIARSGYSTIMDLAVLNKKAVFIPTPGQTEQEYLAKFFMRNGIAFMQKQAAFDLALALVQSESYKGFNFEGESNLSKRIELMLS